MQSPAPGRERSQAGDWLLGRKFVERGPGGQDIEEQSTGCPCSDKGSSHPALQ